MRQNGLQGANDILKPLRIGIIGYGAVAEEHELGWKLASNPICAIADPHRRELRSAAIQVFNNANDMLEKADLNIVDICTPHHMHWPQVEALEKWPGGILVEKPLLVRKTDLSRMLPSLKRRRGPLILRTNKRFEPHVIKLVELLEDTSSSSPLSLKIVWRQRPQYMARREWYYDQSISGGGVIFGMGSHYFEILASYFPGLVIQSALRRTYHCPPNSPDTTSENYAHLRLASSRGPIDMTLSCWKEMPRLPFEQVTVSSGKQIYRLTRPGSFDKQAALRKEFGYYVECLRNGRSTPTPELLNQSHKLALNAYAIG